MWPFMDHKTSHKGQYFNLYIIINKLSIDVWFVMKDNIWLRYNFLKIWNLRVQNNLNIEKTAFKVVQVKFLAMYITNQKLAAA